MSNASKYYFYAGSYADSSADGVYYCRFDPEVGSIEVLSAVSGVSNPSFLTIVDGRYLYAVSETMKTDDEDGGSVVSYAIDSNSGALSEMNRELSKGGAPCHITATKDGQLIFVSNYAGANAVMYRCEANGHLGGIADQAIHHGSSVNERRQEGPHPHSVFLSPDERFLFVPDLGIDKVMIYDIDREGGKLIHHAEAVVPPGAGPRHFAFHPKLSVGYVVNEMNSTVTVFSIDSEYKNLIDKQHISTLPDSFAGNTTCADIHVSQDGKYLYASNRGHDSIAVFAVDEQTGTLTAVGHVSVYGKSPRNFALTPDGRFMLVANQDSDNIVPYRIDSDNGMPERIGESFTVSRPVCVQFVTT